MRWKSAKEEYRKTLLSRERTKYGYFVFKRNYMYYDLMKFMYNHVNINDNEDKLNEAENMKDLPGMITIIPKWSDDKVNYSLVQILRESAKIINDDDYSFFKSILPMVRNLNPEDRLKFRENIVNYLLDTKFKKRLLPKVVTETPAFNINSDIDTHPKKEPVVVLCLLIFLIIVISFLSIQQIYLILLFQKSTETTLKMKRDIVRKFNEGISIPELAYEYDVFTQTIVNLIKSSEFDSSIGALIKTELFTKMERLLLNWIKAKQKKCEILSSIVICERAMKIYKKLKVNSPEIAGEDKCINFEASESWLESYLEKHGLLSSSNNSIKKTSESRKRKLSDHQEEPQIQMVSVSIIFHFLLLIFTKKYYVLGCETGKFRR